MHTHLVTFCYILSGNVLLHGRDLVSTTPWRNAGRKIILKFSFRVLFASREYKAKHRKQKTYVLDTRRDIHSVGDSPLRHLLNAVKRYITAFAWPTPAGWWGGGGTTRFIHTVDRAIKRDCEYGPSIFISFALLELDCISGDTARKKRKGTHSDPAAKPPAGPPSPRRWTWLPQPRLNVLFRVTYRDPIHKSILLTREDPFSASARNKHNTGQ